MSASTKCFFDSCNKVKKLEYNNTPDPRANDATIRFKFCLCLLAFNFGKRRFEKTAEAPKQQARPEAIANNHP